MNEIELIFVVEETKINFPTVQIVTEINFQFPPHPPLLLNNSLTSLSDTLTPINFHSTLANLEAQKHLQRRRIELFIRAPKEGGR